jgi:flagellar basal-body rod protein FlgC
MNVAGSALTAQRFRMDVIGENIANATTTAVDETGDPYRRKTVLFQETVRDNNFSAELGSALQRWDGYGVRAVDVVEDTAPFKMVYDPQHPDADEEGYLRYPNVDMEKEVVDMIAASRSYEANITVMNNFKNIAMKALEIGRA